MVKEKEKEGAIELYNIQNFITNKIDEAFLRYRSIWFLQFNFYILVAGNSSVKEIL